MNGNADRRSARISVERPCTLIDEHAERHDAMLLDVSRGGFRLRSVEPFEPGEQVSMEVGNHRYRCLVRWRAGNEAGGVFLDRADI